MHSMPQGSRSCSTQNRTSMDWLASVWGCAVKSTAIPATALRGHRQISNCLLFGRNKHAFEQNWPCDQVNQTGEQAREISSDHVRINRMLDAVVHHSHHRKENC